MEASFLQALNKRQKEAVGHDEGPALVLAGAGSGKTRVLTSRVARLLMEQKTLPEQILLLTFTNKAACEMKSRVTQLTQTHLSFSGTFHSLATKILRRYAPSIKLDHNFIIYDSDDQLALIKQICKEHNFGTKTYKPATIKAGISEAKNHLLDPQAYKEQVFNDFGHLIAQIYPLYQKSLEDNQALDFDDLLNRAWQILKEDHYVRRYYQELFQYILIDEYQDTNQVQYQLSRILAQPQDNLFVVGDFNQSIYTWRGADAKNLFTLQKDYPHLTTYHLDQNYRSTQVILTGATQVIQKDNDRPVLTLWTDKKDQSKIKILDCDTGQQEAQAVAEAIQAWQTQGQLQDCAILYRTNAQSRLFEEALTYYGLPYKLIGGVKFYERKEIKDILAYLRYYVNPQDQLSLTRIRKIGVRRFNKYLLWLSQNQENPSPNNSPLAIIQSILEQTNYLDLYDAHDPEDKVRLDNINELLTHASQFKTITEFLENVALIQDDYSPDGLDLEKFDRDQITMMSLHSAKGLEFPLVFMVGLEENCLPHIRSLMNKEQLAEERRLCYVGMTRAKQQLYLTYARRRWSYTGVIQNFPSRFLDDLSPDLCDLEYLEAENYMPYQRQKKSSVPNSARTKINIPASKRQLDLDDCQLQEILEGSLDYETFLRS